MVSTTERPRLHLPPTVLWFRFYRRRISQPRRDDRTLWVGIGRTCSNHLRACSGNLYFWQCSFKSSTSLGKIASKSLSAVGMLVVAIGF